MHGRTSWTKRQWLLSWRTTSATGTSANPHAAYLFLEGTEGYNGLRMHLTKTQEEIDPEKIEAAQAQESHSTENFEATEAFLVHFKVDEVRPLVKEHMPSAVGTRF